MRAAVAQRGSALKYADAAVKFMTDTLMPFRSAGASSGSLLAGMAEGQQEMFVGQWNRRLREKDMDLTHFMI